MEKTITTDCIPPSPSFEIGDEKLSLQDFLGGRKTH